MNKKEIKGLTISRHHITVLITDGKNDNSVHINGPFNISTDDPVLKDICEWNKIDIIEAIQFLKSLAKMFPRLDDTRPNYIGHRFGSWTIIRDAPDRVVPKMPNSRQRIRYWEAQCDCGFIRTMSLSNIRSSGINGRCRMCPKDKND
jgi:hypothetical protein